MLKQINVIRQSHKAKSIVTWIWGSVIGGGLPGGPLLVGFGIGS